MNSTRKVGGPRFLSTLPRNLTPPKIEEGQPPGWGTQESDPPEKF